MGVAMSDTQERKFVVNDDPSAITDHAFVPRGEWYTLCESCGLAEAAHFTSTIDSHEEMMDSHRNNGHRTARDIERERRELGGRARIYYDGDDD